ncbi:DMT family transporter [Vibrio rhizosphaerae]|uniref:DMT family transporter n=1 Tax=Vibrio rhizosphaerae TaxID=398736 RepID=A0ABU4INV6_9VIBR|nr:DMT family transporter [Vibrio rhizosphaerae]MDW6091030.1 DMT family transporter [Vibrio rhizosphaerae]
MPYFLLILAAMFWGGNYVVGHILVAQADPIVMTEARWLLTAILLGFLYFNQVKNNLNKIRNCFIAIIFLSVFGQVLFPLTLYIGLQTTTSLNAAIYMSATPGIVLIINGVIFRDKITLNNILGVILSTFGVFFLVMKGNVSDTRIFHHINTGDLWAMGSALSWAFYCSFLRLKDKTIPSNAFVTVSSFTGAVILVPIVWYYTTTQSPISLSAYTHGSFLAGLLYLVLFPSWLSYVFWNKGIGEIGATRGEIYTHIIPLSGGVFSIVFLDVQLKSYHIVSALLIGVGIWFCSKKLKPKSSLTSPLEHK